MLLNSAKARAAIHDREYVIPDDVLSLVEPTLAHRLVLDTDADLSGRTVENVLEDLVTSVPLPEADLSTGGAAEVSMDD
jgi:MoxR-like ATPase